MAPALGIGDDEEHGESGGDGERRPGFPAADGLVKYARAQRERQHHGRGEQRLNDDDSPDPQRGRLAGVANAVGGPPLGRTLEPPDVSQVVMALLAADGVTGETVVIDGGRAITYQ